MSDARFLQVCQVSQGCIGLAYATWRNPVNDTCTPTRAVLRTAEAAAYCGSSASTFEKLRLYGGGPIYSKIGRRVVYRVEDLDAWLAANTRRSTSDVGSR